MGAIFTSGITGLWSMRGMRRRTGGVSSGRFMIFFGARGTRCGREGRGITRRVHKRTEALRDLRELGGVQRGVCLDEGETIVKGE